MLAVHRDRFTPVAPTGALASLFADECTRDAPLLAMPRAEVQMVVRFNAPGSRGLDVFAFGVHDKVRRKVIRAGQRTVTARLHLAASEAVLGVPASALAGRIVALEDLWGDLAVRRLLDRLAAAPDDAPTIVEQAIADRIAIARPPRAQTQLAIAAAERLATASVHDVAAELGVSERHLRRIFHAAIGVNPKPFAKLARFHRALRAARETAHPSWAAIAVATGYYDQAHLIDEFRTITGVTPSVLLGELATAH